MRETMDQKNSEYGHFLGSGHLIDTGQSSKYCLAKVISKPLTFVSSVKVSGINDGIRWNFSDSECY